MLRTSYRDFAPRIAQVEADPARPCPFCPGHEESTPPALESLDEGGHWRMRVVPNLYPAFDGLEPFAVHHLGPVHIVAEASGIHEVFVLSPDHEIGLHGLGDRDAADGMRMLARRLADELDVDARLDRLVETAQNAIRGVEPQAVRDNEALRQQISTQLSAVAASLDQMLVDQPRRRILRPAREAS